MERNMWEIHDLIIDWFECHDINTMNIYIMGLIVIEQLHSKWDQRRKKVLIREAVQLVLDYLIEKEKIGKKEAQYIKDEISKEKEILGKVREILFDLTNCPNLLQKDKFSLANKSKDKKLSKMHSKKEIKYGLVKNI